MRSDERYSPPLLSIRPWTAPPTIRPSWHAATCRTADLLPASPHRRIAVICQAVDAKLQTTRVRRWRSGLWKAHLDEIERTWEPTLREWIEPSRIPDFAETVRVVEARLRALGL